jgi:hypothetical protein
VRRAARAASSPPPGRPSSRREASWPGNEAIAPNQTPPNPRGQAGRHDPARPGRVGRQEGPCRRCGRLGGLPLGRLAACKPADALDNTL